MRLNSLRQADDYPIRSLMRDAGQLAHVDERVKHPSVPKIVRNAEQRMNQLRRAVPLGFRLRARHVDGIAEVKENEAGRKFIHLREEVLESKAIGVLIEGAGPLGGRPRRVVPSRLRERGTNELQRLF